MPETHMPDEKNIDKLHLRQPEIKQKPVLEPVREELPLSPHNPDNIESDTKSTKNLPIKSSDLEKTRKAVNSNDKDSKPTDDIPNDTEKLVKEPTKETPLSSDGDNNKNENNPKPSNTLPLFNPWWALRPPVTKSDNKSPNLRSVLNNDSKPSNDNPHEEWNPQDRTETKVPHIDTRVNNPEHQTKPPKESLQNAHPQKTKEPKKKSIPDDISALLDKFPRPNGIKKTNKDRGQDDDFDDLGEIDKVKSGFNRRDHTLDQPSDKDENTKLGSGKPDDGNKHDADDDQDEFEDLDKPKEAGARSIDEEPDTKPSNPQVASEKFGTENPKKIKEDDSPAQTRPTEKLNDQPSDTAQENNEPERRNLLLLKPKKEDGSDSSEDPKTDDEKTSNLKPDQSNEKTQNNVPERSKLLLLKPKKEDGSDSPSDTAVPEPHVKIGPARGDEHNKDPNRSHLLLVKPKKEDNDVSAKTDNPTSEYDKSSDHKPDQPNEKDGNNDPEKSHLLLVKSKTEGDDNTKPNNPSDSPVTEHEKPRNPKPDETNEINQNNDPEKRHLVLVKPKKENNNNAPNLNTEDKNNGSPQLEDTDKIPDIETTRSSESEPSSLEQNDQKKPLKLKVYPKDDNDKDHLDTSEPLNEHPNEAKDSKVSPDSKENQVSPEQRPEDDNSDVKKPITLKILPKPSEPNNENNDNTNENSPENNPTKPTGSLQSKQESELESPEDEKTNENEKATENVQNTQPKKKLRRRKKKPQPDPNDPNKKLQPKKKLRGHLIVVHPDGSITHKELDTQSVQKLIPTYGELIYNQTQDNKRTQMIQIHDQVKLEELSKDGERLTREGKTIPTSLMDSLKKADNVGSNKILDAINNIGAPAVPSGNSENVFVDDSEEVEKKDDA
uniref:Uncharacterized protein n=1 Tax=Cacopsylla melanoneura TaxID=428564 RepID=A0A8D8SAE3_9HEMI